MLKEYARFDLLLIDEFGFDLLEREAQILKRARSTSGCLTLAPGGIQRPWQPISTSRLGLITSGDPPVATAFLDRLVDGAVILRLTGLSDCANRANSVSVTVEKLDHAGTFLIT